MKTQTFNVTPDQLASFRAAAVAKGITIPSGNSGQVTDPQYSLVMDFTYDGSKVLKLTLVSDAWWVPDSEVWSELDQYVTPVSSS